VIEIVVQPAPVQEAEPNIDDLSAAMIHLLEREAIGSEIFL